MARGDDADQSEASLGKFLTRRSWFFLTPVILALVRPLQRVTRCRFVQSRRVSSARSRRIVLYIGALANVYYRPTSEQLVLIGSSVGLQRSNGCCESSCGEHQHNGDRLVLTLCRLAADINSQHESVLRKCVADCGRLRLVVFWVVTLVWLSREKYVVSIFGALQQTKSSLPYSKKTYCIGTQHHASSLYI